MIDWHQIKYFTPSEFSEDPDKYLLPKFIYALDTYRGKLGNNQILPSPVSGALARISGSHNSRHYIGSSFTNPERKSTAVDIFCEGIPFENYQILLASRLFKGIGVYLDTIGPDGKPWVMFHIDQRAKGYSDQFPMIWVVEKIDHINKYRYPQKQFRFWKLFDNHRLFINKKYGYSETTPETGTDNNGRKFHLGKNFLI